MAHLSLSFLGPFQATLDGQPLNGFDSDKVRALLAYLAVESDRAHRRQRRPPRRSGVHGSDRDLPAPPPRAAGTVRPLHSMSGGCRGPLPGRLLGRSFPRRCPCL